MSAVRQAQRCTVQCAQRSYLVFTYTWRVDQKDVLNEMKLVHETQSAAHKRNYDELDATFKDV